MATSKVSVTEGSGKNLATHSITEDAMTKEVSRANLNDVSGNDVMGATTDARATQTDTTSVKLIPIWKQISFSIQALVTAFGAALTRGSGAADSNTQRVTIATGDQTAQVADNADAVAASASELNIPVVARLMGWNGASYDRLQVDGNKNLKTAPAAGENHLGEVGGNTILFSVTPTLDTSAYAAGDVLFDRTVLTNFFRKNDGTGILQSIQVIDQDDNGVAIDFYLQTTNQTLGTANAAPSISDANAQEILGPFSIAAADYKDLGGVKVGKISGLAQAIKSVSGARTLYISAVVTSGTPTFTASGIVLRLGALLD